EFGIAIHHLSGSLANNDETHDDRLLGTRINQEIFLGQAFYKTARIDRRLLYMIQIIWQPVFGHKGLASASTLSRNFTGRSPGVNKSTSTPRSNVNSASRSPRSNNVAPGSASTSRSRSLPLWSVPCSTEPKTRGL